MSQGHAVGHRAKLALSGFVLVTHDMMVCIACSLQLCNARAVSSTSARSGITRHTLHVVADMAQSILFSINRIHHCSRTSCPLHTRTHTLPCACTHVHTYTRAHTHPRVVASANNGKKPVHHWCQSRPKPTNSQQHTIEFVFKKCFHK